MSFGRLSKKEVAELERLSTRHGGRLQADDVWKAARPASSPLHGRFEWDVQKAAIAHWREQARDILQLWIVVVDHHREHVVVSLGPRKSGYIKTTTVGRDVLVAQMIAELASLVERHAHLRRLAPKEYRIIELALQRLRGRASAGRRPRRAEVGLEAQA